MSARHQGASNWKHSIAKQCDCKAIGEIYAAYRHVFCIMIYITLMENYSYFFPCKMHVELWLNDVYALGTALKSDKPHVMQIAVVNL